MYGLELARHTTEARISLACEQIYGRDVRSPVTREKVRAAIKVVLMDDPSGFSPRHPYARAIWIDGAKGAKRFKLPLLLSDISLETGERDLANPCPWRALAARFGYSKEHKVRQDLLDRLTGDLPDSRPTLEMVLDRLAVIVDNAHREDPNSPRVADPIRSNDDDDEDEDEGLREGAIISSDATVPGGVGAGQD